MRERIEIELTFLAEDVLPGKLQSAVDAGEPPDFEFANTTYHYLGS